MRNEKLQGTADDKLCRRRIVSRKVRSKYGFWAGVTHLRNIVLMSPKKDETAVHCCNPALSVLVMFGFPKRLSRSISLAVRLLSLRNFDRSFILIIFFLSKFIFKIPIFQASGREFPEHRSCTSTEGSAHVRNPERDCRVFFAPHAAATGRLWQQGSQYLPLKEDPP